MKPELYDQSSATPEQLPATAIMKNYDSCASIVMSQKSKFSIEPRMSGNNQIVNLRKKSLLLDNDDPTTYKEVMMGPNSFNG